MPEAMALYGRLEAVADLPSSWSGGGAPGSPGESHPERRTEGARGPRRAVETLLREVLAARLAQSFEGASERPTGERAVEIGRWTVVERRRLTRVLAERAAGRHRIAELESGLADAMERRDELAANLSRIEGSSSYRLLAAWWRLAGRFRRRGRGPGGGARTPV